MLSCPHDRVSGLAVGVASRRSTLEGGPPLWTLEDRVRGKERQTETLGSITLGLGVGVRGCVCYGIIPVMGRAVANQNPQLMTG